MSVEREYNAIGWSEREFRILRSEYPRLGAKEVSKLLPGRTPKACNRMACKHGIQRDRRLKGQNIPS